MHASIYEFQKLRFLENNKISSKCRVFFCRVLALRTCTSKFFIFQTIIPFLFIWTCDKRWNAIISRREPTKEFIVPPSSSHFSRPKFSDILSLCCEIDYERDVWHVIWFHSICSPHKRALYTKVRHALSQPLLQSHNFSIFSSFFFLPRNILGCEKQIWLWFNFSPLPHIDRTFHFLWKILRVTKWCRFNLICNIIMIFKVLKIY